MEKLLELDEKALIFLNNLGCLQYDEFWLYVSDQWFWVPLYIMLFIVILQQFTVKHSIIILASIGVCFFCTDFVVSEFIKPFFARERPCFSEALNLQIRNVKENCGGKNSFFSSHAANTMGLAILLGKILYSKYKYAIYILLAWSLVVAYSRIYLGVHYPLDVLAGCIYGALIASVVHVFYKKLKHNVQKY